MGILEGIEVKFRIKFIDQFIQEVKISDVPSEKPEEVIFANAWNTALFYGLGFTLYLQATLLLDGFRQQSKYEMTT